MLYELATGKRPFPETHGPLLINAILNQEPELPSKDNPQISAGLESVIWKALRKNRADRYQSVGELEERSGAADRGGFASDPGPVAALAPRRLLLGYALLLIVLVISARLTFCASIRRGFEVSAGPHQQPRGAAWPSWDSRTFPDVPIPPGFRLRSRKCSPAELAAGEKLLTISGRKCGAGEERSLPARNRQPGRRTRSPASEKIWAAILSFWVRTSTWETARISALISGCRMRRPARSVSTVTRRGSEAHLDDLITLAGSELRGKLGVGPTPAAEEVAVKAELPSNVEAARFYSEGLQKLRNFEPLAARDLLEKAVAADPRHAMSYAYLAAAWKALGYDQKAVAAAQKAVEFSGGLRHEEQLRVQGQYYEASHQWDKAIETYRSLYQGSPDNLDYGLRLANAQIAASKVSDALATLAELRRLPPPQGEDLRIDLDEVMAANEASDYKRTVSSGGGVGGKGEAAGRAIPAGKSAAVPLRRAAQPGRSQGGDGDLPAKAQDISAAIGDRAGEAAAINTIANALYDQGDLDGARKMYDQAGAIYRVHRQQSRGRGRHRQRRQRDQRSGRPGDRPEDVRRSACAISRGWRPDRYRPNVE